MIDLNEEFARMEDMLARREVMALGVTCKEMIELITRLRQAEKDASRYRWLRDVADDFDINDFFMCSQVGEKRDAFADEAMNASNN